MYDTDTVEQTPATILYSDHQRMVNGLTERIEALELRVRDEVRRHAEWKKMVREAIIDFTDEGTTPDRETVNGLLGDLGLDLIESEFNVEWREAHIVWVNRTGTVTAEDEDSAKELLTDDPDSVDSDDDIAVLIRDAVGYGDYEPSDQHAIEVGSIEEA